MVVGISRVELFLPDNHSLKDKRHTIRRIVEKTRPRFNISIMEIEQSNLWQKAVVGFAVLGVNRDHVDGTVDKVCEFIESLYIGEIIKAETEIIVVGDAV
jgi:uncharacterized protein